MVVLPGFMGVGTGAGRYLPVVMGSLNVKVSQLL